jgi:O-antigen/teichoic acid export membrane protein
MADTLINSSLDTILIEQTADSSFTGVRRAFWSNLGMWSSKGFLALLDQGLISGANFIMAILLARQLLPAQYGGYALAFEVFLFLSVVYGALVLEPLSVFGASVYRSSPREYLGILLRAHGVMAAGIFVLLGISAWIIGRISATKDLPSALFGVAIAAPCVLLFWLARRGYYVKLSPRQAVLGAAVYFVVVLGGLLIVYHYGRLSPLVAFLLMAAGGAATAPIMLVRLKPSLRLGDAVGRASEVLRRHWGYGRWALGSALAIWFSGAIFYPLVSVFHGLGDAGALKALMNFSSPVGQVFAAMSLLSLPYAAGLHHDEGSDGSHRLVWRLTAIYAGGTALYWMVIIFLRQPIVDHLYAGKYLGITNLIPWVGLGSVLRISATAQAVTLRAMHSPALVFVAYAAASGVAVLVGIPCTWAFGLRGAVFTLVLSSAVALTVALAMVHRGSTLVRFFKG